MGVGYGQRINIVFWLAQRNTRHLCYGDSSVRDFYRDWTVDSLIIQRNFGFGQRISANGQGEQRGIARVTAGQIAQVCPVHGRQGFLVHKSYNRVVGFQAEFRADKTALTSRIIADLLDSQVLIAGRVRNFRQFLSRCCIIFIQLDG